jgi:malonyl-CoA O-methyltransferase
MEMAAKVDRDRVRESFHRQASDYDRYAVVQKTVVERILGTLQAQTVDPERILDVGAGTGRLLARLHDLYPHAFTVGADLAFGMCQAASATVDSDGVRLVNADAERLPFSAGSFDLVLSTSTYQWLTTLDVAFQEVHRVLSPGGVFCFALFGEKTLFELRDSYKAALGEGPDRSHSFFTAAEVLTSLEEGGFAKASVKSELEVEFHQDVPHLLRSLKRIGAGTVSPVAAKGLSERRVMLDMMEIYRKSYATEVGIPSTYEVIYGMGRKRE